MANRTVKDAKNIHGTNPQYLVEKIIRSRIYDSKYWKEQCFALTAELLVDKAMELRFIGGVFGGNIRPTPFLCLILKMLQIQPEKDIVVEFIKNEEFKYVRALGAFYLRLTGTSIDCYKYLEPLYNDNRKLRRQNRSAQFEIVHIDEFIDELLRSDRVCDIILPRIQKRHILEENNEIEPKVSALDDDLDEDVPSEDEYLLTEKSNSVVELKAKDSYKSLKRERSPSSDREKYEKYDTAYDRRKIDRDRDRERYERDWKEREARERDYEYREKDRDRRSRYEREERPEDRDRERRREKERERERRRH